MSNEDCVTLTYQDRIALITLNRPDKLNALNQDLYYLLADRLREIEKRDDIFITVITGTGRFFSAYAPFLPSFPSLPFSNPIHPTNTSPSPAAQTSQPHVPRAISTPPSDGISSAPS